VLDNANPSNTRPRLERFSEPAFYGMLTLATAVFMLGLRSLYSTPIADSYLWWGDESWLMIEFRTQMLHGVFQHPYALASSLSHGSGIVLGNMWVPAMFYGLPAALISPESMDIVLLGRTITALFAFTLLVALYEIARRLTGDRLLAIFSVLLLVTSRSFLFTSHSARYDELSALAILSGMYLLQRMRWVPSLAKSLALGFLAMATMLITVHVTFALFLAAFLWNIYRSKREWPKHTGLFLSGALIFLVALSSLSILSGQATLFGTSSSAAFWLNVHDIPALRFYSRSVQVANIVQRWKTFLEFGSGYITVSVAVVLLFVVKVLRDRSLAHIGFTATLFIAIFISWLELESSAPTSYLIYILPVLSVASVLIFQRVLSEPFRMTLLSLLAIALTVLALKEMPGPHGKGYRIMTDNYQAVAAAVSQVHDIEESAGDTARPPLVLAFNPAVHELLRDSSVSLMTTHFIEFPEMHRSIDSVLKREGVKFVLLYASAIKPDYMREVAPIQEALARIGTPIWERPGYFTDIGRSYFDKQVGTPDTIRLYQIHE